jgi:YVTN family beta-propeller protein
MQVTRNRRRVEKDGFGLLGHRRRRDIRFATAGIATLALLAVGAGVGSASTHAFGTDQVGQTTDKGTVLASDQFLKPIGDRLLFNQGKFLSSAISPDGTHLAAITTDQSIALTIVNLGGYKVQQTVGRAATADVKIESTDVGQEGPTYSPDGKFLWLPQTDGYDRFPVNADGTVGAPAAVKIPADGARHALSAQAVFSPDGSTVYAAVNGQNRVVAIDAASGMITRSWTVGNAPRDMVRVGDKLYVSNEGGRPATGDDTTINSYNTPIVADPKTGASTTGTVSVIDTAAPDSPVRSLKVGLHPTALYTRNGTLFVADTGSDDVSVIDTSTDKVVQTIATQPWPQAAVGYEPDGITLTDDGHLLVTLGRANAVAVYRYTTPREPVSYIGLLPTDHFPENVTAVGGQVLVTNLRGIDDRSGTLTISKGAGTTPASGRNTHNTTGTLTRFRLPNDTVVRKYTATVFAQNGWTNNDVNQAQGSRAVDVPIPKRLGDPSTIKHVFMIIKENRTYDQVFGDDPRGNGDPSLTQFGENATPNQHTLARQFGLYDNFYDVATNSSEGHTWLLEGDDPEYMESQAGEYQRAYQTSNDSLGAQRSGYIWTGAEAAGKTFRDFGENLSSMTESPGSTFPNLYCDTKNLEAGKDTAYPVHTASVTPSLNDAVDSAYPLSDHNFLDLYRYEMWKKDFEKNGPANLNLLLMPNNHTGGAPVNPIAQVADNDLAVGKFVDTISHSKYWKDSVIFVVEDDTQDGVDHVDGMRGPVQVISPWAQHGVVDSHYYTQISMVRTIEQILGIQPMNQKDSAATPMFGAFTSKPDYTPYNVVPNRIPLTYGLTTPPACGYDEVPAHSQAPAIPAKEQHVAGVWQEWAEHQRLTGPNAQVDYAPPALMNHYTWYAASGWTKPYPGETRILTPDQVPGGIIPSAESDG